MEVLHSCSSSNMFLQMNICLTWKITLVISLILLLNPLLFIKKVMTKTDKAAFSCGFFLSSIVFWWSFYHCDYYNGTIVDNYEGVERMYFLIVSIISSCTSFHLMLVNKLPMLWCIFVLPLVIHYLVLPWVLLLSRVMVHVAGYASLYWIVVVLVASCFFFSLGKYGEADRKDKTEPNPNRYGP